MPSRNMPEMNAYTDLVESVVHKSSVRAVRFTSTRVRSWQPQAGWGEDRDEDDDLLEDDDDDMDEDDEDDDFFDDEDDDDKHDDPALDDDDDE